MTVGQPALSFDLDPRTLGDGRIDARRALTALPKVLGELPKRIQEP